MATLSGTDVVVSVSPLGITAAELAAQSVEASKLDAGAGLITACFNIVFGDQGTTVTGPTLLANSVVQYVTVNPSVAFDDDTTLLEVLIAGVSFMATDESDVALAELQSCKGSLATTLAAVVTAVLSVGSANTAGDAEVCIVYRVQ